MLGTMVKMMRPDARAALACYCMRIGFLRAIGLAIAEECERRDLISQGGSAIWYIFQQNVISERISAKGSTLGTSPREGAGVPLDHGYAESREQAIRNQKRQEPRAANGVLIFGTLPALRPERSGLFTARFCVEGAGVSVCPLSRPAPFRLFMPDGYAHGGAKLFDRVAVSDPVPRDGNMRLTPTEEFLRHANECRLMAKSTRISEDKAIWTRMADRWQRCADWFEKQTLAAHEQTSAVHEAVSHKPHGRQHRYLAVR